jgi:HlyD family secretion protein
MTANVSITTARRDDAVRVPTAALRFRPPAETAGSGAIAAAAPRGGPVVWVLGDDARPHVAPITTGIADERFTEITSGLDEGARVVTGLVRVAERDDALPRSPFMPSIGRRGR